MSVLIITDDPSLLHIFDEIIDLDYSGEEYDDWYCIQIKPFKCTCGKFVCYYIADNHLIIIFKEKDCEEILQVSKNLKEQNLDPYIIKYNRILDPCIEYEIAKELDILVDV